MNITLENTPAKAIYIKKARLIDPSNNRDEIADLYINASGTITPVPEKFPPKAKLTVIEQQGLTVLPGLCDVHVHFREPGNVEAEDLKSGSYAAAQGGFTRVVTMPNTNPPIDTQEALVRQRNGRYAVAIYPSACATLGRNGTEPSAIETLAEAGASTFTDDGAMVANPNVMKIIMQRVKKTGLCVMEHAVIPEIAQKGIIRECETAAKFNLPIFPAEAEIEAVRQDIELCRHTKCPLHIQHISCAGSVELVRAAQAEGLPVTAEATPHHLALCAEDIPGDDGNFRMNPPLGLRSDREALRKGLLDGTISIFATDHAPHLRTSKSKGFAEAPFGVIGLETAVGVTWTIMVKELGMSPLAWAKKWITNPNALINKPAPTLECGNQAELAIFDFETPWQVNSDKFISKSINTPFNGMTLFGQTLYTYRNNTLRPAIKK